MSVIGEQSITALFTTQDAGTGAASDADSTPTATLYKNGTANGASVTVTNVATGLYMAAVTLPSLTGGDHVEIVASATVGGIAGKGVIWRSDNDRTLRVVEAI